MDEEFRRIPGWPQYFINRSGEIKRMQRRGRNPRARRNINGEFEITLREDQTKFITGGYTYKIKDLIKMTWPNEEGYDK